MKKTLYPITLVMCTLLAMAACNSNHPDTDLQQELLDIIHTSKSEQLDITENNIIGNWEYMGYAWGRVEEGITTIAPKEKYESDNYYVFHVQNEYDHHEVNKLEEHINGRNMTMTYNSSYSGTWEVEQDSVKMTHSHHNLAVYLITDDHIVFYSTGDDGSGKETIVYNVYKRIQNLPDFPPTLNARLLANEWALVSDSVIYSHQEDDGLKVLEKKVNQLKQNLVWHFEEGTENVFQETDTNGSTLHESTWQTAPYGGEPELFLADYTLTDLYEMLNITGSWQGSEFTNYLYGKIFVSSDNKTTRFTHSIMYLDLDKRWEYPIDIVLVFEAR